MLQHKLTGRRRLRLDATKTTLVLQIEYTYEDRVYPSGHKQMIVGWRDAKVEDLTLDHPTTAPLSLAS